MREGDYNASDGQQGQRQVITYVMLFMQELPFEEVKEDLIESGQSEEILQRSCPAEYSGLKEEEVRTDRNVVYILRNKHW